MWISGNGMLKVNWKSIILSGEWESEYMTEGWMELSCVCGNGRRDEVKYGVEGRGCDAEMEEREGRIGLVGAWGRGDGRMVGYLIVQGSEYGVVDRNGETASCERDAGGDREMREYARVEGGGDEGEEGEEGEGEEWDRRIESGSVVYRHGMKYVTMPGTKMYSCRGCERGVSVKRGIVVWSVRE